MEFLEDTEKRILLSAISREKKVCEQVDKERCREPYETSLTAICKSLEYKFMYDRLFKKIYEQGRTDAVDDFQEWLKTQVVGIDNTTKEILVVVGDRWELAVEKYKGQKNEQ